MKMEHRHSSRHITDIQVTIAYAPLGIINGRMINISADGLHVDTGPIRLKAGQYVEVFFQQTNRQLLSLKALTVYTRQTGTGILFIDDAPPQLIEDITQPLYQVA